MSDTTTCSNCGTEVPSAAAFCTGCGQSLRSTAAPAPESAPPPPAQDAPPPPPVGDATRVDTPGLHDATQVAPAAAPEPPAGPPPSPFSAPAAPATPPSSTPPGPWGPSGSPAAPTSPTGPPTSAPWNPPASPPPPTWQQPVAPPPGAATFTPGGTAAGAPPAWGDPASPGGAPAWGAQSAAAPAPAKGGGSVIGGIVGLIGAVLAIVGIFSGWVKLGDTGTVSAWSLTGGDGLLKSQTPYVILALAGFALAASLVLITGLARTAVRIITALLGVAIIGVTAGNWAEIASFVNDNFPSSFNANTAIGFYLTIAGGVLVIIAALLPGKKAA